MKASAILGLNARTMVYSYGYNKNKGKVIAASKLKTKKALQKADIPIPDVYKTIKKPETITTFDWQSLPKSFALKPSKGLGGDGIIVIKKRSKDGEAWIGTDRRRYTVEDLKLHTLDILEGAYSMRNTADVAYMEEYVGRHKAFRKYAYRGTPDIRVIVFNKVPVMAMLRLPTKDSGGRANLHQGAVGVGIDIATGITTRSIWYGDYIKYKPGTKRKLNGIKIPNWTKILKIAVDCSSAVSLGYVGVDVVMHPSKGPMVLEINYQPGLQIQLANKAGLRKRLERVEDLKIKSSEHGVNIAKTLFAEHFSDRVRSEDSVKHIAALEEITIRGKAPGTRRYKTLAKIDTGAWRTSISYKLAEELGLLHEDNILWYKHVRSSLGKEKRPVIGLTFWLAGRKIKTPASVAKRMALKYPVIIGRKNLKGFLVDPDIRKNPLRKKAVEEAKQNT